MHARLRHMRRIIPIVLFTCLAVVAGCSSSADEPTSSQPESVTSTPSTQTSPPSVTRAPASSASRQAASPVTTPQESSAPPAMASSPSSKSPGSSNSSPPPASTTRTPSTSLPDRLAAAGIDCGKQKITGDVKCTYQGAQVTVSTTDWASNADLRQQACDQGYINKGYIVATDHKHLTVSADQNATAQAIAKALGIAVATYCPQ